MGIVLKIALQPFISLLSFFKVFYLPKFTGISLTEDDCVSFNKVYYTIIANEDQEKQKEFARNGQQYLLASWGMVPYAYNKPVKPSTEREMLYASLGAMKNRDLNVDNTQFEIASHSVISNNLSFMDFIPRKPTEIMNFRPSFGINTDKALALLSMLQVLARSGDLYAKELLDKYYTNYKLFILLPDFSRLEDLLVGYRILIKYSDKKLLKIWLKIVTMIACLVHKEKLSNFGKHIAKEIVNNDN